MSKMTVIQLLNKIANGEEVPIEIKYNACLFAFERQSQDYYCEEYGNLFEYLINEHRTGEFLNDEVEIIEEDKKIPEKLDVISWDKCIHGVTHKEKELAIEINKTQELLNQVIDYLKSKGE